MLKQSTKVTIQCANCGVCFLVAAAEATRKFCSWSCYLAARAARNKEAPTAHLIGQRFGRRTILSISCTGRQCAARAVCQCECGNIAEVDLAELRRGCATSCQQCGSRNRRRTPLEARLWPRINKTASCWLWTGSVARSGYAGISLGGRQGPKQPVHRVVYELLKGPIPDGLHLDHLCRVRHCCNPDHLEPVTPAENLRRGEHPHFVASREGRCIRGHAMTPDNAGRKGQKHYCRQCQRDYRATERFVASWMVAVAMLLRRHQALRLISKRR